MRDRIRDIFHQHTRTVLLFAIIICFPTKTVFAQDVSVGKGSYSLTLPPGAVGPSYASGAPISPKISPGFDQPIQTNDFWSSLIFPFFGSPYSNVIYAHPVNYRAVAEGMEVGYTLNYILPASDYLYPPTRQITVGVSGLAASETLTRSYGDWTVTAAWDDGQQSLEATIGHGLPFSYYRISGGDALITTSSTPNIWFNEGGVLGITVDGVHYGIFGPSGASWTTGGSLQSSLNGQDYLSVALLPDSDPSTLELFRRHAYAFVTGSVVEWSYSENTADLISTFSLQTELVEQSGDLSEETLTTLYPHQWRYTDQELSTYRYRTRAGEMRLLAGNSFGTRITFDGLLPALPDVGAYNRTQLNDLVQDLSNATIGTGPTYENGKQIGKFTNLVHIADQIGAESARDHFLSQLKNRLEDWLTAGGAQEYSYDAEWDVLTGYPSGFGADREINDHHFHSGYAIYGAATIAQYDSAWASQENWGGMINLLIRDAANWDRSNVMFPFLRSFDAYAGHSWAAGHADFVDGNNQESSSESMNFSTAVVLWGANTGQTEIRDLGIFLHATERTAIEEYWFDVHDEVFPANYPHKALGIVWGSKGAHATWFGGDPEFVHGINLLPITGGSLYLGRHPDYVVENYAEVVQERGGQPVVWKDVFWQYLSMADPDQAISYYQSDPNYQPFDGESRAHTLHWLYNMKELGRLDTTTVANIPTYAVFMNDRDEKTYVAYNPEPVEAVVIFSDGFSMEVPSRSLRAGSDMTVSNEPGEDLPADISLSQNYPNPFNPVTQISFEIPKTSNVELSVYNMLGQRVVRLVNERRPAGSYTETFEGSNLSSGVYFYVLKAGEVRLSKRMTLIK